MQVGYIQQRNMDSWSNAGFMLAYHLRCWTNIKPALGALILVTFVWNFL